MAYQAPLSMGFSRQEHRSGLPFSSPINGVITFKNCKSPYCTPIIFNIVYQQYFNFLKKKKVQKSDMHLLCKKERKKEGREQAEGGGRKRKRKKEGKEGKRILECYKKCFKWLLGGGLWLRDWLRVFPL